MHLLIPFASALSEASTQVVRDLELPRLAKLLARMTPTRRFGTDEYSLSTPHERALADALGWQGDDGALPWAARWAAAQGIATDGLAWGMLSPTHWHVGSDHISLLDPATLNLSESESRQLLDAVRHLFESEGWRLEFGAPTRWYAAHPILDGLACASLDRVIGRNVDRWLPGQAQARLIRRLQNEVQMLLYHEPINNQREARGELSVNSFWLSGCGRAQPATPAEPLHIDDSLRAPLLAQDWAAWADAWRALDAGALADLQARSQRNEAIVLTLSGERHAQRFEPLPQSVWQRVSGAWRATPPHSALEAL